MVHSSRLLKSLVAVAALALAVGGCWSSERGDQGTSQREAAALRTATADAPATEPVPLTKRGDREPTLGPPGAVRGPTPAEAATQPPKALAEAGPDDGGIPDVPAETTPSANPQPGLAPKSTEPESPGPEPSARPGAPRVEGADSPRLGHNPLRDPTDRSPGLRSVSVTPASVKRGTPGKDEGGEEPFDPIRENGPIFVGWGKPRWALVITGRQDGYLEPCGCAGLERMKGGLSRRLSMFQQLRKDWGTVAAVDVGGLVKGFGPQADLKFQTTINVMKEMRYDAIAIGKAELQFGESGVGSLISVGTGDESPFLSANVALFGFDAGLTAQKRIVDVAGVKLGITAVLGAAWQREIHNSDVEMADPAKKLAQVVPALAKEADVLVLLAHATKEESIELARKFPQFHVVVTAGGPPEPPAQPEPIDGVRAMFVEVGEKGMNAIVLGFFDNPARPIQYQRVPLDSRFPQSDYAKKAMALYQEGLKDAGLEGLRITPVPYPGKDLMGKFVGSEKCKPCHEESYTVWKKSGHAKAWKTLVELDPPRNFDPECISCHVVGWSPQNYLPLQSGFLSEKETPELVNVGCETCHGPGEKHVEAENGSDLDLQEKLSQLTVITLDESQQAVSNAISDHQQCMNCHDLDNSPDFHFETYWPKIEHREE